MLICTAEQMREADRRTIEEVGLPGMVLMENAAQGVASVIEEALGLVEGMWLGAFCGRGNNGGDGLAVLRILANRGADCTAYLFCQESDLSGDAAANLAAAKACGVEIIEVPGDEAFDDKQSLMWMHDAYIDALLGTGLNSEVRGRYARAIDGLNQVQEPVFSVDIPSGLSADTGAVLGTAVRADYTITFGLLKLGLALDCGDYTGEVHLVDISIPPKVVADLGINASLMDEEYAAGLLPPRPLAGHKGSFGHLLVAGGSWGMTGAVCMAAWGGIRAGAGLVTACLPLEFAPITENKLTSAMSFPLPQTANRSLGSGAVKPFLEFARGKEAVVLGPGLGQDASSFRFAREVAQGLGCSLVIDADGLNALAGGLEGFSFGPQELVLTPHPGEAARLLDCTVSEVQKNRPAAARALARKTGAAVVLKGARSIVAAPDGRIWINPTGNQLLATGGSGDVLAGVIGGLLAQGLPALDAACCGTYVHGLAADLALEKNGVRGMAAEELPDYLVQAFNALESRELETQE